MVEHVILSVVGVIVHQDTQDYIVKATVKMASMERTAPSSVTAKMPSLALLLMENASAKKDGELKTAPWHVQKGLGVRTVMLHASVLTKLNVFRLMGLVHVQLDGEEHFVTRPVLWEPLALAASISVTAFMIWVATALQDSATACLDGQVHAVLNNVHRDSGVISATKAVLASMAPPVCLTVVFALASLDTGDLSVNMPVQRVFMESSAVVFVDVITNQPVTRMERATVCLAGLELIVLSCAPQVHMEITVDKSVCVHQTGHVILTLVTVYVNLGLIWTVHKSFR